LIREAFDLDIICYFNYDDANAGDNLEDIFSNVKGALEKEYYVTPKTSALRLKSKDQQTKGLDFHIDVVPGRFVDSSKGDAFLHQAQGKKERLKTNLKNTFLALGIVGSYLQSGC